MRGFNITAIVNGHREGLLALPSLLSLNEAVISAEESGLQVEVIGVLDRPDATTIEVFERCSRDHGNMRLLQVDHADLGKSRNSGVAAARGQWIAFLDADDLWCVEWLSAAYRAARRDARLIVWHPEVNVYFGTHPYIFSHLDMEDPEYDHLGLALNNYWTALCFAPRSLLLDVPYPETTLDRQLGYEDWAWNMETIARGAIHKIVHGTGHAIRTREESLVKRTIAAHALPRPSELFRSLLDQRRRKPLKSP